MARKPEDMTIAELLREVKRLRRMVSNFEAKLAESSAQAVQVAQNDLLTLEEVAEITRMSVATIRWKRSRTGDGPPLFKQGRRLVCWRNDLMSWIKDQQVRDRSAS